MNKKNLLFSFVFCCAAFLFAAKPLDNTFKSSIQNKSDFEITVDGATVLPGMSADHKFPLHESAIYDGYDVEYKIPLSENVSYLLKEKKYLADNQGAFVIENPIGEYVLESYLILNNDSDEVIKCSGPKGRQSLSPIQIKRGIINDTVNKMLPVYQLAAHTIGVVALEPHKDPYVAPEGKESIATGITFRRGYVYYASYKDDKVVLVDARPIQCIKEKLWNKKLDKKIILREIVSKGEKLFVVGTETTADTKKNLFVQGFIQCLNAKGEELWKQEIGIKGSDTYLYDANFTRDGNLVVVGQSIKDEMEGLIASYDTDGKLIKTKPVESVIGFEHVSKDSDGDLVLSGYDKNENIAAFFLSDSLELKKIPVDNSKKPFEKYVQNVSATVSGVDGIQYLAGESALLERPVAIIVKVSQENQVETVYTATESFSYVMDMKINREKKQLLICGSMNAEDQFGNQGNPFIRCIDIETGKVVWESIFKSKAYEVAVKICELENYGFGVLLVNADEEGNISSPCALIRTDAVGKFNF